MPSSTAWYRFCSCGRLSLNVGVISSSSTVNWCGSRWSAFTASKPCDANRKGLEASSLGQSCHVTAAAHDLLFLHRLHETYRNLIRQQQRLLLLQHQEACSLP